MQQVIVSVQEYLTAFIPNDTVEGAGYLFAVMKTEPLVRHSLFVK